MKSLNQCPLCGSGRLTSVSSVTDHLVTGEVFEIVECPACGARHTSPVPSEEEIGRYYESEQYKPHSDRGVSLSDLAYRTVRGVMIGKKRKWIERLTGKKDGQLLDVGCGTGEFAASMRDNGWDVTCVDSSEAARKEAHERFELEPLSPAQWLETDPARFDCITFWHTLEHVHEPRRYLNAARSGLQEGGVLLIGLPNFTSHDAVVYGDHWAAYDVPRHLTHFSPSAMDRFLTSCGFALEGTVGLPYDAYYVSLLSARYRGDGSLGALWTGFISNRKARSARNRYSSLIYAARRKSID